MKLREPTQLLDDGTVSADGSTPADPNGLAAGAGMGTHTYAAARMAASEAGGLGADAQRAVIFAAYNHARATGHTLAGLLERSITAGNGFFGKQDQGRYASTSHDSTAASRQAAIDVLHGKVTDPTNGAQQWDSPRAYSDWDGSHSDKADAVADARLAAGNELVVLDGVDVNTIRFWRPQV